MNTSEPMDEAALLSEGLGSGIDPNLSALLGMLGGSGDADPMAILRSRLEAQAQTDPRTAHILQFLEQRRLQQMQDAAEEGVEDRSASDDGYERAPVQEGDELELHDLLEQAYAELESMRLRNDALAAALGACHLCFGSDPHCVECGGRGVPGSRRPEPAAFRKYVLPALRRIKTIEAKRGGRSPPAERQPGQSGEAHAVMD